LPEEHVLDPAILNLCKSRNIAPSVDETGSGSDGNSGPSPLEDDPGRRDMFEEIVEQPDLDKFSATLREAQRVALATEGAKRVTYTGRSRTTQYRRNKVRIDLASKGFLPVDEFMKWTKAKRQRARSIRDEPEENSGATHSSAGCGQGRIDNHDTLDTQVSVPSSVANARAFILHMLREEEENVNANPNAIENANADNNTNVNAIEDANANTITIKDEDEDRDPHENENE